MKNEDIFKINKEGEIRLREEVERDSLEKVTIPDKVKGIKVTSIGESAFENCLSFRSITIGNSIISIGEYAFYRCISLRV